MNQAFILSAALLLACLFAGAALAQETQPASIAVPNAGFEEPATSSASTFAGYEIAHGPNDLGLAKGWGLYQWGTSGAKHTVTIERGAGRTGNALRAQNLEPSARAGAFWHVPLAPGIYELSVWARAAPGQTSEARIYLGQLYSRQFKLTDQWRLITLRLNTGEAIPKAEVNVQNSSGKADSVWFDDVELKRLGEGGFTLVDDTRAEHPRTLMFSPINVNHLKETAPLWAKRGFKGFLFDAVMAKLGTDIWAVDGKPDTRGEGDLLFREVKACNDACRAVGIDSNFVKVAFYDELPSPFDDAAWAKINANLAEGARFAKLSGCAGIAIDTEYVAAQYNPDWAGYKKLGKTTAEIGAKMRQRWQEATAAMLAKYPNMVLLTLPESMMFFGELAKFVFEGMLDACAKADAPGGMHLLAEQTYRITGPLALAECPLRIEEVIQDIVTPASYAYWKNRCSVALGAWPLGYYRSIVDATGKEVGYSGRKETFGDKIVGSYADKSAWYTPEAFAGQMAALNTYCPKYNWIYAHGAVFWQLTPAETQRYAAGAHKSIGNTAIPTVDNLEAYFEAIAHRRVVVVPKAP